MASSTPLGSRSSLSQMRSYSGSVSPRSRQGAAAAVISAGTSAAERNSFRPSAEPVSASTACSGWGIRPMTLPAGLETPAMPSCEPLGIGSST